MKRGLAFLVALFLFSVVFQGSAESIPYTLEQKIVRQLGAGSGIKGTVTFSSVGDVMPLIDSGTWQLIARFLPGLTADIVYIKPQGARRGESRVALTLKAAGKDLAQAALSANGRVTALESSLLPEGLFGAADLGDALTQVLLGSAADWPPLGLAAFSILTADEEWNGASQSALATYTAKLGVWLQAYTSVETIRDENGQTGIRHTSVIPFQAVKAEAKQLLIDLYTDDTLLSLLQMRLTPGESAAYLQKSMMPSFFAAIDALPLAADTRILRTYDMLGNIRSEELSLPLAGASGFSKLMISREAQEEGTTLTSIVCDFMPISAKNASGAVLRFTLAQGAPDGTDGEGIYSGTVTFTPEPPEDAEFSVQGAGQAEDGTVTFSYNLFFSTGAETFDAANDMSAKGYEATLVIKPEGGIAWNALSLSLTASLTSASSPRSSTRILSSLAFQDLVTGSRIAADFDGRTTAPWTIPVFIDTDVTRIDLMPADQFLAWIRQVSEITADRFNAALLSLITP